MAASSPAAPASKRALPMRGFAVICGVVALIVLLIGGYAGHWAWTGFSDNDTLWDWLQLLLLPVAIATLPIWVRHGRFLDPRVRIALGVGLLVFLAIVLLGYLMPWKWTGFTGNTLWDWLGLVLLPFVIATIRYWSELARGSWAGTSWWPRCPRPYSSRSSSSATCGRGTRPASPATRCGTGFSLWPCPCCSRWCSCPPP